MMTDDDWAQEELVASHEAAMYVAHNQGVCPECGYAWPVRDSFEAASADLTKHLEEL